MSIATVGLLDDAIGNDPGIVKEALRNQDIDYEKWGDEKLEHFIHGWYRGDFLWDLASKNLEIHLAVITVRRKNHGGLFDKLRETRREFSDNRVEQKLQRCGTFVEKMRGADTGYSAAIRGMAKKLGQTVPEFKDPTRFNLERLGKRTVSSGTYPAYQEFQVNQEQILFQCDIDPNSVLNVEKYIYVKGPRTIHFGWPGQN
jgi:hypothetical protein